MKTLDALPEQYIGQFDNWLDKQVKLHHQQYKASCLPKAEIPTSQPPANQAHHLNNELLIKCHLPTLTPPKKAVYPRTAQALSTFTPAEHLLNIALLINQSIEQWQASASNSQKVASLQQSVNNLLKSNFR